MVNTVKLMGIAINYLLLLLIIGLFVIQRVFYGRLFYCINYQSPKCPVVTCPCAAADSKPCRQNAKKSVGTNKWVCSNASTGVVDDNGKFVENL